MERSLVEYTVTGQSDVFMAVQELKLFNGEISKYAVVDSSIQELREYVRCEMADLELFRKYLELTKRQLEDLLLMKYEIDKNFINKRFNKGRMLAPNDSKDIKKIKGRIIGLITVRAAEVLKTNSFLKLKAPLKTLLETKNKEIIDSGYEQRLENR